MSYSHPEVVVVVDDGSGFLLETKKFEIQREGDSIKVVFDGPLKTLRFPPVEPRRYAKLRYRQPPRPVYEYRHKNEASEPLPLDPPFGYAWEAP